MEEQLSVRLPGWLLEALDKEASDNERSKGGQIRHILRLHYDNRDESHERSLEAGSERGYEEGQEAGYEEGAGKGYEEGYAKGHEEGHDEGYQRGYQEALEAND